MLETKKADQLIKTASTFIKTYARKHNLAEFQRAEEEPITPTPRVETKKLRFFDVEFNNTSNYNPQTASLVDQIKEYQSAVVERELEVLDFWRKYSSRFPILAKIVKRVYCIQATSVPSERLFSAAGYSVWERRCALSPEKINKILVVQQYEQQK